VQAPPWKHYGWVGFLIDWIDLEDAKTAGLPDGFELASFFRSDTLSCHTFASFQPGAGTTFKEPFHEFSYLPCLTSGDFGRGFVMSKLATDNPSVLEGEKSVFGIDSVPATFKAEGDYGLSIRPEGALEKISVKFRKWNSLGYWRKTISFVAGGGEFPSCFQATYHGELYYCRVDRSGLGYSGRLIPLLLDRCWVTLETWKVSNE